ncbi:MAG: RNA polymerase subunit sigma-24 [Lutibacter sp.]|nr:MAG: RNA polymerase subunit sigma-24 [Lutibacter sp.]
MKNAKNTIDTNLVIEYQSGNKKAIALLVKRWHIEFCKFAFWYTKDADVAKDIAQDCWTVILNKLDTLQEPKQFKSWAISIVNRKSIDWIRKRNREREKIKKYSQENSNTVFEENTENQEEVKLLLLKTIKTLSKHQQTILKLFYTQNYTLKEISELLKISIGTVKSRLFHAREKLKITLKHRKNEKQY